MSKWLANAIEQASSKQDWFQPLRAQAIQSLAEITWPTRKTEAWKYTSLRAVERFKQEAEIKKLRDSVTTIDEFDAIELVFENGHCQFQQIGDLPKGLTIVKLNEASSEMQSFALQKFSSVKPKRHLFGLINDALVPDLVYIKVADQAVIDKPIRITSLLSEQAQVHTRVFVELGQQAKACIVEHYKGELECLNTGFIEYSLANESCLEHYRFALQSGKAVSIGGSHFELAECADLNSTVVGFGSDLSRLDIDVIHSGERAFAKLNAFYLLDNKETFDLHTTIEHAVPNGTTEENVRIIAGDKAKAVFNGRIHIHRDAQKTLAELNNRNLLMSHDAEINTKPELEIYADDVRCAHGATVAEIDKKAMYYLQSRGVPKEQAQVMLNFGFINELIDEMPNQALAQWLRPQMKKRFAAMKVK
ncbi:Fe-S cluster assembly protein SufD [Marinomonas agarivorans]|nr:Fe-S cluster assembly protein SufD [Marinomonas agarivorans]